MYAAIAIVALGTTVITTTATNQMAYAGKDNNGIGNDFTKDDDKKDGNQGLGNSYTSESNGDKNRGIGNDVDRGLDGKRDDGNQGIGNDPVNCPPQVTSQLTNLT